MPPSQAGVAAAVASTSRQVGQTLGVAVLGALAGASASAAGIGRSFAAATHSSWWILVALSLLVLALGVLTTTGWAQQTALNTAERFREVPDSEQTGPGAEDHAELVAS